MTRHHPFARALPLPGWSSDSRWGYDACFESFWAELVPRAAPVGACSPDGGPVPSRAAGTTHAARPWVLVGPECLLPTLPALAGVVAAAAGCAAGEVLLAMSC